MKNIFYSLLAGIVALVVITGCKKTKHLLMQTYHR